jgi:hypothetical protein
MDLWYCATNGGEGEREMTEDAILAPSSLHAVAACCLTVSTSNPSIAMVGAGFLEQSTDGTLVPGGWQ